MRRLGLIVCIVAPALLAGALVLSLGEDSGDGASGSASPPPPTVELRGLASTEASTPTYRRSTGREALAPRQIRIPGLEVRAPVTPVGVVGDAIRLPPVTAAGWFAGGPLPGEPGRTVIVGHRDSVEGPAIFSELPDADPGERIVVRSVAGSKHAYRVKRVIEIDKQRFPAELVYSPTRRSTLALITCGGDFDTETGHYENSVIVFAAEIGARATRS